MDLKKKLVLISLLFLLGCTQTPHTGVIPTATKRLIPGLSAQLTPIPDVKTTARAYLDAWKAEDYAGMYDLLTSISQDALSEEEFIKHYQGVAAEAALSGLDYEIYSILVDDTANTAQVSFHIRLYSRVVGEINAETLMNLSMEAGAWRVKWDDTLVLPQLAGGNHLAMELQIPARANIYDRNGHALVAQADATAIGLIPDQIQPDQEAALFEALTRLTGLREDQIKAKYSAFPPGAGWYLPLGEIPADRITQDYAELSKLGGLVLRSDKWRYYFENGIASHILGYVSQIQPDEVEEYKRKGYRIDERVGRDGLEKWGEPYLGGKRGGALYVFNAQGQPVTKLAETPVQPSQAIYTTLDREFQIGVQKAIDGFRAAAVVLELGTGRVLAMASSPSFDPNAYEPANYNFSSLLEDLLSDPNDPFLNRAAQGQYPLGSVFKIITMAAGLESGRYAPDSTYQCGYYFNEGGFNLNDWTWDQYQADHQTMPSGLLTLQGGLIRSCNPWFWHIGLDLYDQGLTKAVSDMARGFGLGSKTGIEGIDEAEGQVPDPASEVDAVNLAIGQGDLLVTPLQVADFVAAIGNGGTLYRPQVIERIAPPGGDPTYEFKPVERGKLPVSPENLQAIQEAMVGVITSTKPRGTAVHRFANLGIPVAGKTGTAQSGSGQPHAWFAGYTFAGREDKPDIAVAVVVENIGEGSEYAAPIFRRIIEQYFYESPRTYYWWESTYGVTSTPLPEVNSTPVPEGTQSSP